jgi:hypothetical protein
MLIVWYFKLSNAFWIILPKIIRKTTFGNTFQDYLISYTFFTIHFVKSKLSEVAQTNFIRCTVNILRAKKPRKEDI